MKLNNMKLARKWREYAGPKDERLEAENAKIYKLGFMLLSFGMLTLLVYQIMAQQVAWVHDDTDEAFRLFANPVDAVMYAWLFIVMLICAVLQTRKGYVDGLQWAVLSEFSLGYRSSGQSSSASIFARRCFASKNAKHSAPNTATKMVTPNTTPVARFAPQKTLSIGTICASAMQRIAAMASALAIPVMPEMSRK